MIKQNQFTKILEKVQKDAPQLKKRSKQALDWFRKKLNKEFGEKTTSPFDVYPTQARKKFVVGGQLITFQYSPKGKKTLPYYDKYPLTLMLSVDATGFIGINFHYLRPIDRALFMGMLYKYVGKRNEQISIILDYKRLKKIEYYKPCIKRYLYKNMSSITATINPEEWDIALFLPTEKFQSQTNNSTSKNKIWEDSRRIIKEGK